MTFSCWGFQTEGEKVSLIRVTREGVDAKLSLFIHGIKGS